jgi:hypothetical protein
MHAPLFPIPWPARKMFWPRTCAVVSRRGGWVVHRPLHTQCVLPPCTLTDGHALCVRHPTQGAALHVLPTRLQPACRLPCFCIAGRCANRATSVAACSSTPRGTPPRQYPASFTVQLQHCNHTLAEGIATPEYIAPCQQANVDPGEPHCKPRCTYNSAISVMVLHSLGSGPVRALLYITFLQMGTSEQSMHENQGP